MSAPDRAGDRQRGRLGHIRPCCPSTGERWGGGYRRRRGGRHLVEPGRDVARLHGTPPPLVRRIRGLGLAHCRSSGRGACQLARVPLIASGGLRGGLDLAKALALGANLGRLAGPFVKAAHDSAEAVIDLANEIGDVLRTAMFALGAVDIHALQTNAVLYRLT